MQQIYQLQYLILQLCPAIYCIVGLICIRTERVNYNSVGESLINSMQNCKSIVPMVYECYLFNQPSPRYGLHYNVLLEMMMSVLQEVKGLTKKLYSIILPVERPVSMQNFRLNLYTVFLF